MQCLDEMAFLEPKWLEPSFCLLLVFVCCLLLFVACCCLFLLLFVTVCCYCYCLLLLLLFVVIVTVCCYCYCLFWTRPNDRRCMSVRTRTHHEELLSNWIRETAQLSQERSVASKVLLKSIATPDKTTWEQLLNHIRRTPSTTRIDISNHPKNVQVSENSVDPQPSVADTKRQSGRGNIQFKMVSFKLQGTRPVAAATGSKFR